MCPALLNVTGAPEGDPFGNRVTRVVSIRSASHLPERGEAGQAAKEGQQPAELISESGDLREDQVTDEGDVIDVSKIQHLQVHALGPHGGESAQLVHDLSR